MAASRSSTILCPKTTFGTIPGNRKFSRYRIYMYLYIIRYQNNRCRIVGFLWQWVESIFSKTFISKDVSLNLGFDLYVVMGSCFHSFIYSFNYSFIHSFINIDQEAAVWEWSQTADTPSQTLIQNRHEYEHQPCQVRISALYFFTTFYSNSPSDTFSRNSIFLFSFVSSCEP